MGQARIISLALKPKIVSRKNFRQNSTMENQDSSYGPINFLKDALVWLVLLIMPVILLIFGLLVTVFLLIFGAIILVLMTVVSIFCWLIALISDLIGDRTQQFEDQNLELVSKQLNHFGVIADLFRQIGDHSSRFVLFGSF